IAVIFVYVFYNKKIDNYSDKLNLVSLIIMVLVSVIAYEKIVDHDIRILYSLGLIIASGVGRYGTELSKKNKVVGFKPEFSSIRQIIYTILFISGLIGLLS
ncbi:MAG: hypothetical protein NUV37_03000, partial [Nanoarchaeota archaeon]|nr:hypothetical protein [Nanoarchaeota archaeon]